MSLAVRRARRSQNAVSKPLGEDLPAAEHRIATEPSGPDHQAQTRETSDVWSSQDHLLQARLIGAI